ncbi:MAG TPA: sigma 54-interacting transcriptional regulator [Alphaproteobacteria bacterium]|nr:sigma 54-interacting transcriptional regulator [Alphaproteobacteria bacterium]
MNMASDRLYDKRFDSNFAIGLLTDIALERSLDGLKEKLISTCINLPEFARIEMWLIDKGDICLRCPQRMQCRDQSRCLHLAAVGTNPAPGRGREISCLYRSDERIPLGVGLVGRLAVTGGRVELDNVDKNPGEVPNPEWLRSEHVRRFAAAAISFRGQILGINTVFSRIDAPKESRDWLQVFSDHVGISIANAQAFEEIQRLKAQVETQNAYLQEEVVEAKAFGELIGQSPALRHIVRQIDLAAPTEASVLILGESGTGKELVAREIHNRSRRKDKSLVRVNCASIPKDLFESEFFGHARGAFTGAIRDRAGRFETADGGTLFLDELGEVPLDLQSKLLRVLQEKRYERVGEDRTRSADVRVIAATNRDLKQAVTKGLFREDLFYRLNVFPIEVPPLQDRIEDVPLLAKHFVELSAKELHCPKPRLTRAGIAKLQSYDWPGNIRELRNVIERAVIVSRGGVLDFELPVKLSLSVSASGPVHEKTAKPDILTDVELRQRERDNLLAALKKTDWKIKGASGAAELLGLQPATLKARMKKMGLERPANLKTR